MQSTYMYLTAVMLYTSDPDAAAAAGGVLSSSCRSRAPGNVPADAMAVYYSQRATQGGLLISEATCISQQGQG
jgi:hypothetical protein